MKNRDREKDMKRLARLFLTNLRRDNCAYGSWGINPKRPFGNSDVESDILEALGIKTKKVDGEEIYTDEQREYAASLYNNLGKWMRGFAQRSSELR